MFYKCSPVFQNSRTWHYWSTFENISQPTLESIVKYHKYPSIAAISQAFPNKYFNVSIVEQRDMFDQIMKLKHKKATQDSDIPVKVLKFYIL